MGREELLRTLRGLEGQMVVHRWTAEPEALCVKVGIGGEWVWAREVVGDLREATMVGYNHTTFRDGVRYDYYRPGEAGR
jgi:hypothetical protein